MNRRKFLAGLGFGTVAAAAAASGVLDVERLLWTPDERTIFLPPAIAPLSEALTIGDVFTIDGVFAVNPLTRKAMSHLQIFVATRNVSGVLTADRVLPRMFETGQYQNVSRSPVVGGKIDGRRVRPVFVGDPVTVAATTYTIAVR